MSRREAQLFNALTQTNRLLYRLRFGGGLVPVDSVFKQIVRNNTTLRHHCPTCKEPAVG